MSETIPITGMQGKEGSWHHRAVGEFFMGKDFSRDTTREITPQLVSCETHDELVANLTAPESDFDIAMIAVDNTNSGRVTTAMEAIRKHVGGKTISDELASALEALRNNNRKIRILGKIALSIEQRLLYYPGHTLDDIEQVISQRPALDQAAAVIDKNELIAMERNDTAASATEVRDSQGMITGPDGVLRPTAAIASALAGKIADLEVSEIVSPPGNATTFWLVTSEPDKYEGMYNQNPDHAAFTFSVEDKPGELLHIVKRFSEAGFDFTDIDCHLDGTENKRSFFAEIKFSDDANKALFERISSNLHDGYQLDVLGVYEDRTDESVHATALHTAGERKNRSADEVWKGRDGVTYSEGAQVIYVQASNFVGSLQGMLQEFEDHELSITDMSRPYMPEANGSRGFYFVFEPEADVNKALTALKDSGYTTEAYTYAGDMLKRLAA